MKANLAKMKMPAPKSKKPAAADEFDIDMEMAPADDAEAVDGMPDMAKKPAAEAASAAADLSDDELLAEMKKRGLKPGEGSPEEEAAESPDEESAEGDTKF